MKLLVPSRFELEIIEPLKELSRRYRTVYEVYGSLPSSVIGHGRPTKSVLSYGGFSMEHVREFVKQAHSIGVEVNFLLNSPCLGNIEYSSTGREKIVSYLGEIYNADVDMVTVAIPFLIDIIKREFPDMKVNVSVIAQVNNTHRAKLYERLDVDRISIDYMCNRNFNLLENLSESSTVELELLTNDGCLFYCPYEQYHRICAAHSSKDELSGRDYVDYCLLRCVIDRAENLTELLRSPWIRPENINYYEERFHIHAYKVSGRLKPIPWILNAVEAYSRRKYEGNLLDLLGLSLPSWHTHLQLMQTMEKYGKGNFMTPDVFVDNRKLDDFFRTLVDRGGCGNLNQCETCRYCDNVATDLVEIRNREQLLGYTKALKGALADLVAGEYLL